MRKKSLLIQKEKPDLPESGDGQHVIAHMFRFLDRYLATPIGSQEARKALDTAMQYHFCKKASA